jgi:hypothetical protein
MFCTNVKIKIVVKDGKRLDICPQKMFGLLIRIINAGRAEKVKT